MQCRALKGSVVCFDFRARGVIGGVISGARFWVLDAGPPAYGVIGICPDTSLRQKAINQSRGCRKLIVGQAAFHLPSPSYPSFSRFFFWRFGFWLNSFCHVNNSIIDGLGWLLDCKIPPPRNAYFTWFAAWLWLLRRREALSVHLGMWEWHTTDKCEIAWISSPKQSQKTWICASVYFPQTQRKNQNK